MSNIRLQMQGLSELRDALRQLPEALTAQADAIVLAHAEMARADIQGGYPQGPTGNLRAGVRLERNRSKFTTQAIVKSVAKHAVIFERGTVRRATQRNANRGRMPEASEAQRMIPKAIRARKRMTDALVELVRSEGFEVTTS